MTAFRDHIKKQVQRRLNEFQDGIDIDALTDNVEEYAVEIADDLRNRGEWRDHRGWLWNAANVAEELDNLPRFGIDLRDQLHWVFADIIRNPSCLAVAIETASPANRVILEKLRDLVHGCLGLLCADLAIEKYHHERDET